jgi:hypothetical protein
MINRDKRVFKFRRLVGILSILVLFLLYLIKVKFDSEKFILDENQIMFLENLEKDKEILILNQKLDSLTKINHKPVLEKIDTKNKINTKKEKEKKIPKLINDSISPSENAQKNTLSDTI